MKKKCDGWNSFLRIQFQSVKNKNTINYVLGNSSPAGSQTPDLQVLCIKANWVVGGSWFPFSWAWR